MTTPPTNPSAATTKGPCVAFIQPLRERRFRHCGKPGKKFNGDFLCARHLRIRKDRASALLAERVKR